MSNIPDFKTPQEETDYYQIFDEKLEQYMFMMDKVRESMFGTGNGNYANLPGTCLQVVHFITTSLMHDSTYCFMEKQNDEPELLVEETIKKFNLGDK